MDETPHTVTHGFGNEVDHLAAHKADRERAVAGFFDSLTRLADKATELLASAVAQEAEEALERAEDKMRRDEHRARQAGR